MIIGSIPVLSPQAHRRIDQLAFPALLTTAALMSRRDPTAASVALVTAGVEGATHLITDYPPAILPGISFRTHNQWAFGHGLLMAALSLSLPGIARRNRVALCALAAIPIGLAVVSDTRPSRLQPAHPRWPAPIPVSESKLRN